MNAISSIEDTIKANLDDKQKEVLTKRTEKRTKTNEQKAEITKERKEAEMRNMSDKDRWELMVQQRKDKQTMKQAKKAYYGKRQRKKTSRERMEDKKRA